MSGILDRLLMRQRTEADLTAGLFDEAGNVKPQGLAAAVINVRAKIASVDFKLYLVLALLATQHPWLKALLAPQVAWAANLAARHHP